MLTNFILELVPLLCNSTSSKLLRLCGSSTNSEHQNQSDTPDIEERLSHTWWHACNPSTWDGETGELQVLGQLGVHTTFQTSIGYPVRCFLKYFVFFFMGPV